MFGFLYPLLRQCGLTRLKQNFIGAWFAYIFSGRNITWVPSLDGPLDCGHCIVQLVFNHLLRSSEAIPYITYL